MVGGKKAKMHLNLLISTGNLVANKTKTRG